MAASRATSPLSAAARWQGPKPLANPNLSESRLDARLRQGAPDLVKKRFVSRFPLRRSISELGSEPEPEAGTSPQQRNPASSYTEAVKASSRSAHPSRKDFLALARTHTLVPVCRTLMADLETPVSAFLRAAWGQRECFLLESVEGGEQVGRYTFIGFTPFKRIVARGRDIAITEGRKTTRLQGDVFAVLRDALGGHKPARLPGLPPFSAGAVDHVRKEIWLIVTADVSRGNASAAYDRAVKRLNKLEKQLNLPLPERELEKSRKHGKLKVKYRTKKSDFLAAVARTKEYIRAGDAFQVVLSQRFDVEPGVDSFQVYRALRTVNPSPYMFFLRFAPDGPLGATTRTSSKKSKGSQSLELAGSSPELLVRVHQGNVEYRPIAGTRPRGATEAEDNALAEEMLHDEKERAEHVMLVDLGRNDVGRVSRFGSVKVDKLMFVERYSHVMHIVSSIEGKLRPDLTAVDALRACFPAGTLYGAPKVRAMEIIEELEPARRGTYGGAVLYADFSGNLGRLRARAGASGVHQQGAGRHPRHRAGAGDVKGRDQGLGNREQKTGTEGRKSRD